MAKDRRRKLSGEEAALWEGVARTAKPLRRAYSAPAKPAADGKQPAQPQQPTAPLATRPIAGAARSPGAIDRRTARRIARGAIEIDARLDLHGHTQEEAHRRLIGFLTNAREEGARLVLVITGKGTYGDGDRGVLRRALPHWLATAPLRGVVSGFDEAHRSHGGAGAFYVRLKRAR